MHENVPDFATGALLLIDKPLTWTSFDVVNKIRNEIRIKKIGHAGTLDPLATGLLIVCTGKFTKKIDEYQAQEKEYTGTITLGATTPSYDLETIVDNTFETSHITTEMINEATKQFIGKVEQTPPAHSAKKIDGERAYFKARRGEEVIIKSREVEITAFEITRIEMPELDFRIVCSKGTYIRSIANDFGKALNSGGYLSKLCRTRIGDFLLKEATALPDFVDMMKTHRQEQANTQNINNK
jgi:tRNA pseudouridine55 synthase